MTREELHTIIRQAFLAEYGQHNVPAGDARFAAGADHAAGAILAAMQEASPGERSDLLHTQPPEPDAGSARTHDPEPATHRPGFHTIDEARAQGLDPLPWPSEATMDRERITSLAAETARHEATIDRIDRNLTTYAERTDQQYDGLALAHGAIREHDARISAVETLTHNVTELAREIRDLRATVSDHSTDLETLTGSTDTGTLWINVDRRLLDLEHTQHSTINTLARHRQELDYLTGELDTLPEAHDIAESHQDPDQRLGGHDNPHPQHSHFPTPADSDSA